MKTSRLSSILNAKNKWKSFRHNFNNLQQRPIWLKAKGFYHSAAMSIIKRIHFVLKWPSIRVLLLTDNQFSLAQSLSFLTLFF